MKAIAKQRTYFKNMLSKKIKVTQPLRESIIMQKIMLTFHPQRKWRDIGQASKQSQNILSRSPYSENLYEGYKKWRENKHQSEH